jgi:cupin fold WbuC family metalloprotein
MVFPSTQSNQKMAKRLIPPVVLLIVLIVTAWFVWPSSSSSRLIEVKQAPTVSMASSENKATGVSNGLVDGAKISEMLQTASTHPRKRKMYDLTNDPHNNNLQVLVNAWTEGSYSPIHMHKDYDEVFVAVEGSMAFFTFDDAGKEPVCHILSALSPVGVRLIIVEKGKYHALTAAPSSMGYSGQAVVMESSAHLLEPHKVTKFLSPHYSTEKGGGQDGTRADFEQLLKSCPTATATVATTTAVATTAAATAAATP